MSSRSFPAICIDGGITIVLGLVFVGLIPTLHRDFRFEFEPCQVTTLLGAPLLGALGWTPYSG